MNEFRYISIFSGIEAASVAFEPFGWKPVAFSEIEPFPSAVIEHHYPDVPNLGDITKVDWSGYRGTINLVIGGSPCQSFSIAGGRESLSGESRLMYEYIRAIADIMPEWFIWENVPGVFSTRDNAFGQLLAELAKCGYSDICYRVLDAQFFGVPQRRRRVFVVGHLGNPRFCAEAVLFEPYSLQGNNKTSREKREELTRTAKNGFGNGRGIVCMTDTQSNTAIGDLSGLTGHSHKDAPVICVADDNANAAIDRELCGTLKTGGGAPYDIGLAGSLTPWDHQSTRIFSQNGISCALQSEGDRGADLMPAVLAFDASQITSKDNRANPKYGDACHTLHTNAHDSGVIIESPGGHIVRRLTPKECERLQGFPDDYTRIPYRGKPAQECPDTPRYKALGNSFAVPVVRWIGERIQSLEEVLAEHE